MLQNVPKRNSRRREGEKQSLRVIIAYKSLELINDINSQIENKHGVPC